MTGKYKRLWAGIIIAAVATTTAHATETTAKVELTPEYLAQNVTPSYQDDTGKWFTEDDVPTYKVEADGKLDWFSYSGYRRFNSECFVCHGPDGEGSTYAPAIKNSALDLDYYDFVAIVVNGKQNVSNSENLVMPALGTNNNVMCYLDDIYVYLKGRGMNEIPRGRPAGHADKTDAARQAEDDCLGTAPAAAAPAATDAAAPAAPAATDAAAPAAAPADTTDAAAPAAGTKAN